jgi:hypothetical protein
VTPRRVEPGPPQERSFWELLPRRNFRRALLLLAALVAIVVIKQLGGLSFSKLFDSVAPAPAPTPAPTPDEQRPFQRLKVER